MPTEAALPLTLQRSTVLRQPPPQLESFTASGIDFLQLKQEAAAAGAAAGGAASSAAAAHLLPGLTQLRISGSSLVELGVALPRLAALTCHECGVISLTSEQLHLPQLTSLQFGMSIYTGAARLRCGTMPALVRLHSTCGGLEVCDGFAAVRQLTHLGLRLRGNDDAPLEQAAAWLHSLSGSLRSLGLILEGFPDEEWAAHCAEQLAAAGAQQLTELVSWCFIPLPLPLPLPPLMLLQLLLLLSINGAVLAAFSACFQLSGCCKRCSMRSCCLALPVLPILSDARCSRCLSCLAHSTDPTLHSMRRPGPPHLLARPSRRKPTARHACGTCQLGPSCRS